MARQGHGGGCWLHVRTPHCLKEPALLLQPCPQELEEEEASVQLLFPVSLATVRHLEAPEARWWEGCGIRMPMWVPVVSPPHPHPAASQAQKVRHTRGARTPLTAHFQRGAQCRSRGPRECYVIRLSFCRCKLRGGAQEEMIMSIKDVRSPLVGFLDFG